MGEGEWGEGGGGERLTASLETAGRTTFGQGRGTTLAFSWMEHLVFSCTDGNDGERERQRESDRERECEGTTFMEKVNLNHYDCKETITL